MIKSAKRFALLPIARGLPRLITVNLTAGTNSVTVQLSDSTLDRLTNLQSTFKVLVAGYIIENTVAATFNVVNAIIPAPMIGQKLFTTIMPRAYNLALTTKYDQSYNKEFLFGVSCHAAGTVMQEGVDALLPNAPPFSGYVAYGIASGITRVGLEKLFCK